MGTSNKTYNRLGIDIGSTTVKVAILDSRRQAFISDYQRICKYSGNTCRTFNKSI